METMDSLLESLSVPPLSAGSFSFQCLDIQVYSDMPLPTSDVWENRSDPLWGLEGDDSTTDDEEPQRKKTTPRVCLFGCDEYGRSVCVIVTNFRPYFYLCIPLGQAQVDSTMETFKKRVTADVSWSRCQLKHKLFGFRPSQTDPNFPETYQVLKLSFDNVRSMYRAAKDFKERKWFPCAEVCELREPLSQKFLDDTQIEVANQVWSYGVKPMGWVNVEAHQGQDPQGNLRFQYPIGTTKSRYSHCDIEVSCHIENLSGLEDKRLIAPFLVASTDIEAYSDTDEFPEASNANDCIICIGTTLQRFGCKEKYEVVQCLGEVSKSKLKEEGGEEVERGKTEENMIVLQYATESDLLNAWRDLIVFSNVDVITGFNLHGFDYEYMSARARVSEANRFFQISKMINETCELDIRELSSSALGQNDMAHLPMSGRVTIDMFNWIKGRFKLERYGLNFVASHFLQSSKIDLPYKVINAYFREKNKEKMWDIAKYCSQDCNLPLELMIKLQALIELGELSRITMTLLHDVVSRGQQKRVMNKILDGAHKLGYVKNDQPCEDNTEEEDDKFHGATVIEPVPGFYNTPIATLDFASLYPSIMIAENLCYSTYMPSFVKSEITGSDDCKVDFMDYEIAEGKTHTFVKGFKGVLPVILEQLLSERANVKRQMKQTKDTDIKNLLDGRQLAMKIACNSVYGFTGARKRGMYPLVAIAETTTCVGRNAIDKTKRIVEENGHSVVYGDTDSVMIKFDGVHSGDSDAVREAFGMGERMADYITSQFPENIILEMEKVYCPYLLLGKKRYAGLMYSGISDPLVADRIDIKGFEIVRRDTSAFARKILQSVLDQIMYHADVEGAQKILQLELKKVIDDQVPFEDFVLTRALRKDYANENLPHLHVVNKMKARKVEAPRPGDRVPYVMVMPQNKDDKLYLRAEDPEYVKQNSEQVKIDYEYYVRNQVLNPICTMFNPFLTDTERLFDDVFNELERRRNGTRQITDYFSEDNPPQTFDLFQSLSTAHRPKKKKFKVK